MDKPLGLSFLFSKSAVLVGTLATCGPALRGGGVEVPEVKCSDL